VKKLVLTLALLTAFPGVAWADGAINTRFIPLEVQLDSSEPVAAWQFELEDREAATKVVGVENGGHPAFPRAPYYDRAAVARGDTSRIVVADYSLAEEELLPVGRFRLATLHLMVRGKPDFEVRLVTATAPDGEAIAASISLAEPDTHPQEGSP
jgi:hypothetical protein